MFQYMYFHLVHERICNCNRLMSEFNGCGAPTAAGGVANGAGIWPAHAMDGHRKDNPACRMDRPFMHVVRAQGGPYLSFKGFQRFLWHFNLIYDFFLCRSILHYHYCHDMTRKINSSEAYGLDRSAPSPWIRANNGVDLPFWSCG